MSDRVLGGERRLFAGSGGSVKLICRLAEVDGGGSKIKRARLLTEEPWEENPRRRANANANW